jgi:hypothetical protein
MKYFLLFLLTVIIITTYLSFNEELINVMFSNDSAGYLTEVSNINISVSVIAIILFCFFIIKKNIGLLFALIIIWLFSGRRISIRNTEKCRISTGWFFIETNSFSLCKLKDCDCEIIHETTYEKLSFYRVKIKNKEIRKTIFIGPMVWSRVIEVLENNINNGTHTK